VVTSGDHWLKVVEGKVLAFFYLGLYISPYISFLVCFIYSYSFKEYLQVFEESR
jgi:hypothetical protein